MAKFSCICGFIIDLTNDWTDFELALISEKKFDPLIEFLGSEKKMTTKELDTLFAELTIADVIHCPNCNRYHFRFMDSKDYISYVPEAGLT